MSLVSPEYQKRLDGVADHCMETRQAIAQYEQVFYGRTVEELEADLVANQAGLKEVTVARQQADRDWAHLQAQRNQICTELSIARRKGRIALEGFDVT